MTILKFWTGMRLGELLPLQVKDINFEDGTITVDGFLVRIDGEDLINVPKTESSIRAITIQKELHDSTLLSDNTIKIFAGHKDIATTQKLYSPSKTNYRICS